MACQVGKNTRQREFYQGLNCITENMKFSTQQLRSYVLTFWELLHLESDKLFVGAQAFFDLIPAP